MKPPNEFARLALSPDELRQRLPDDLIALPWVCWRVEVRDGSPTKVPVNARSGRNASTTEPESWSSFDHATCALARDPKIAGIGVVMVATDDLVGVDLDECRDPETGEIAPWAQLIAKRFATSYGEVTPSGTGLRFYCRGRWPASWNKVPAEQGAIEVYCERRYFAVTGERLDEHPRVIAECQAALDWIASLKPSANGNGTANGTHARVASVAAPMPCAEDDELLDIARRAMNGARFSALFDRGDVTPYDGDESRADLALCSHLAFYTGPDPARIDRLFKRSALFRDKWLREDYASRTIKRALDEKTEFYSRSERLEVITENGPSGDAAPVSPTERRSLEQVVQTVRRWFYLPVLDPLLVVLATVAANLYLAGDPLWVLLIGASGGGKTELLRAVSAVPRVHLASTLTEASLLSGSPRRDHVKEAKGGLLRLIGDRGVLLLKDFTSILAQNRDSRGQVLAALREVYDGRWDRHVGVDGGRTLTWSGHVGLIAACTPTIDRHHGVISSVGERFLMYRLDAGDRRERARTALAHGGSENAMRRDLADVVRSLFESLETTVPPPTEAERDQLITIADFTARARSPVERDGASREIELIPDAEAPTRIAIELSRLRDGLLAIGVERSAAIGLVLRVALDSMPALRMATLAELYRSVVPRETSDLAVVLRHPTSTVRRTLEDLAGHGFVARYAEGRGKADKWLLNHEDRAGLDTFPDIPSFTEWGVNRGGSTPAGGAHTRHPDFSGTPHCGMSQA